MSKVIVVLCFIIFTSTSFAAAEETSYPGIWQDKENSSHFFVIQESGDRLVLVVLPGIEQSGNTLRFSYLGNNTDFVMSRVSDEPVNDIYNQLQIEFASPDEGVIYPICDACGTILVNIQKIF